MNANSAIVGTDDNYYHHHHHQYHGNENQVNGCTDVDNDDEKAALVTIDNGDIVDFDDEAGGTGETKC